MDTLKDDLLSFAMEYDMEQGLVARKEMKMEADDVSEIDRLVNEYMASQILVPEEEEIMTFGQFNGPDASQSVGGAEKAELLKQLHETTDKKLTAAEMIAKRKQLRAFAGMQGKGEAFDVIGVKELINAGLTEDDLRDPTLDDDVNYGDDLGALVGADDDDYTDEPGEYDDDIDQIIAEEDIKLKKYRGVDKDDDLDEFLGGDEDEEGYDIDEYDAGDEDFGDGEYIEGQIGASVNRQLPPSAVMKIDFSKAKRLSVVDRAKLETLLVHRKRNGEDASSDRNFWLVDGTLPEGADPKLFQLGEDGKLGIRALNVPQEITENKIMVLNPEDYRQDYPNGIYDDTKFNIANIKIPEYEGYKYGDKVQFVGSKRKNVTGIILEIKEKSVVVGLLGAQPFLEPNSNDTYDIPFSKLGLTSATSSDIDFFTIAKASVDRTSKTGFYVTEPLASLKIDINREKHEIYVGKYDITYKYNPEIPESVRNDQELSVLLPCIMIVTHIDGDILMSGTVMGFGDNLLKVMTRDYERHEVKLNNPQLKKITTVRNVYMEKKKTIGKTPEEARSAVEKKYFVPVTDEIREHVRKYYYDLLVNIMLTDKFTPLDTKEFQNIDWSLLSFSDDPHDSDFNRYLMRQATKAIMDHIVTRYNFNDEVEELLRRENIEDEVTKRLSASNLSIDGIVLDIHRKYGSNLHSIEYEDENKKKRTAPVTADMIYQKAVNIDKKIIVDVKIFNTVRRLINKDFVPQAMLDVVDAVELEIRRGKEPKVNAVYDDYIKNYRYKKLTNEEAAKYIRFPLREGKNVMTEQEKLKFIENANKTDLFYSFMVLETPHQDIDVLDVSEVFKNYRFSRVFRDLVAQGVNVDNYLLDSVRKIGMDLFFEELKKIPDNFQIKEVMERLYNNCARSTPPTLVDKTIVDKFNKIPRVQLQHIYGEKLIGILTHIVADCYKQYRKSFKARIARELVKARIIEKYGREMPKDKDHVLIRNPDEKNIFGETFEEDDTGIESISMVEIVASIKDTVFAEWQQKMEASRELKKTHAKLDEIHKKNAERIELFEKEKVTKSLQLKDSIARFEESIFKTHGEDLLYRYLEKVLYPSLFIRTDGIGEHAFYFKEKIYAGTYKPAEFDSLNIAHFFPELAMNPKHFESNSDVVWNIFLTQIAYELCTAIDQFIAKIVQYENPSVSLNFRVVPIEFNWNMQIVDPISICQRDTDTGLIIRRNDNGQVIYATRTEGDTRQVIGKADNRYEQAYNPFENRTIEKREIKKRIVPHKVVEERDDKGNLIAGKATMSIENEEVVKTSSSTKADKVEAYVVKYNDTKLYGKQKVSVNYKLVVTGNVGKRVTAPQVVRIPARDLVICRDPETKLYSCHSVKDMIRMVKTGDFKNYVTGKRFDDAFITKMKKRYAEEAARDEGLYDMPGEPLIEDIPDTLLDVSQKIMEESNTVSIVYDEATLAKIIQAIPKGMSVYILIPIIGWDPSGLSGELVDKFDELAAKTTIESGKKYVMLNDPSNFEDMLSSYMRGEGPWVVVADDSGVRNITDFESFLGQ